MPQRLLSMMIFQVTRGAVNKMFSKYNDTVRLLISIVTAAKAILPIVLVYPVLSLTLKEKSTNKCAGLKYVPEGRILTQTQGPVIQ
jgi:hypothetical protein